LKATRGALPTVDDSVFFKLVRVVNLTAQPFTQSIGKVHRLSLNEWRVLLVLATHAGASASEVAERSGLDKMSVSRAVAALVRRGRVLRQPDAADGRRWRLRLSAEGERLYRRIGEPARERERLLFRGIDSDEQAALSRTLDRLIDNLREPAKPASRTTPAPTPAGVRTRRG
jgi:DNA-binding MarR family transcriptional regulator